MQLAGLFEKNLVVTADEFRATSQRIDAIIAALDPIGRDLGTLPRSDSRGDGRRVRSGQQDAADAQLRANRAWREHCILP